MEIEYQEITIERIVKGEYIAKTRITKPINGEVTMQGKSEEIARKRLLLFLNNKPYGTKHELPENAEENLKSINRK